MRYLEEIKNNNISGIKYLGISVSSVQNLKLLFDNKYLLNPFDVLQINSNIFFENPTIMKKIYSLKKGIILNSIYRKGNKNNIKTKSGLKNIFKNLLKSNKNAIVLTGTSNLVHLSENINYVEESICT